MVHYGILSAQERARSEPELAQALILLAVKRDQAALDTLLADDALLAAIPNALGAALRSGEGDPMYLLQTYGVDVFLVALARALESQAPGSVHAGSRLSRCGRSTRAAWQRMAALYSAERIIDRSERNRRVRGCRPARWKRCSA